MIQLIWSQLKADPVARLLDNRTLYLLAKSEADVQKIENKYTAKAEDAFETIAKNTVVAFEEGHSPTMKELSSLFGDAFFEAVLKAFSNAKSELYEKHTRLGSRIPEGYATIRKWYDKYRKTGELPPKQKKLYEQVKKEYLKKCRAAWDVYGEGFRTGDQASRVAVVESIREAAQTSSSRAKTIVRTETTSAYNATRKQYFNSSAEVTHYLFLAIRDKRTTRWCTNKTIDGKRGRHGLVYAKDDPLCDAETPACHWNCRSTMVPLTRFNRNHLKMIENPQIARRNFECYPLPAGWNASARAA